jgi:hypothetical protein
MLTGHRQAWGATLSRFSSEAPGRAVLEFDTARDPVRVSLSQEQLDRLATEAKIASVKLSWRSQDSEPK